MKKNALIILLVLAIAAIAIFCYLIQKDDAKSSFIEAPKAFPASTDSRTQHPQTPAQQIQSESVVGADYDEGPKQIIVCNPGEIKDCRCASGQQGQQACSSDGSYWLDCECDPSDQPEESGPGIGMECAPGDMRTCFCRDGEEGMQTCTPEGVWAYCECQTNYNEDNEGPVEDPPIY